MENGKRLTKSLGTRDEKEAQKAYLKVRNLFGGMIASGELAEPSVKTFTVALLLSRYMDYLRENERKSADIAQMVIGVIQRDHTFLPGRKVHTLTTKDFEDYRKRAVAAGVSQRTVNYRFTLIRAALRLESKRTPSEIGKVPYIPFAAENTVRDGFSNMTTT